MMTWVWIWEIYPISKVWPGCIITVRLMCLLWCYAWHSGKRSACIQSTIPQSLPLNKAVILIGLQLKAAIGSLHGAEVAASPRHCKLYLLPESLSVHQLLALVRNKLQNIRYLTVQWQKANVCTQPEIIFIWETPCSHLLLLTAISTY